MEYAHYNLIEEEKQSQLLEQVLKDLPYLDPNYHPHHMITKGLCNEHVQVHEHRTSKQTHDNDIANMILKHLFYSIFQNCINLHIIIGTLGSEIFFHQIHYTIFSTKNQNVLLLDF
jgi:hypothetical protein